MTDAKKWVNEYSKVESTMEFRLSSQSEETESKINDENTPEKPHKKKRTKSVGQDRYTRMGTMSVSDGDDLVEKSIVMHMTSPPKGSKGMIVKKIVS